MVLAPLTLDRRTAVVTGAGQGIGIAIVEALTAAGAQVVAIDRTPDGIGALAARNRAVTALRGDVTDPTLTDRLWNRLKEMGGNLHILCNNAGIADGVHALFSRDQDFLLHFHVNVQSLFRLSRWAVARMSGNDGGGAIVNTASIVGHAGLAGSGDHSASKAALTGLTRQMAADFGPDGIRVNAVAPGLIDPAPAIGRTRQQQLNIDRTALRRAGTPHDVARAVRFLASDEAGFITGQVLAVDGGWSANRFPRQEFPDAP
ncbi:SDR family NAD(P)-dependent oxidoreductase [Paracoccus sp. (in: a-proteobacteria)]|uniref:SDR family NAD(P)-dependent oxidoreductase n=1 Tax=Paracoccus sp. TaxID=267 RepID=UPI003A8B25D6